MISLQFSTEDDPVSALIRAFDHGPFSHVDCIDWFDGSLIGARSSGGVAARKPGYAPFSRILRVDLPATDDQAGAFYAFVKGEIGKHYDMLAIGAFVADRDWHDPARWFCSELQAAALEKAGWFPHKLVTPANRITPGDLLLLCSAFVDVSLAA